MIPKLESVYLLTISERPSPIVNNFKMKLISQAFKKKPKIKHFTLWE